ncbi:MAG TPA: hypothetical protein VGF06_09240 [Terriglobales bacterium]|jgi:hypothetical protein
MKATANLTRAALLGLILAAAALAPAQVINSGAQTIALNATLNESLTLSLSGNSVNFNLTAGSAANAGSTNITATTSWVLKPSRTAVKVYAYFGSATAALTDGTNNIPSSAFFIADNAGPSSALTNTVAFGAANAGLQLANVPITGANRAGSRTDIMAFNINLTGGTLPQLPASTYIGTLNIQAQATP